MTATNYASVVREVLLTGTTPPPPPSRALLRLPQSTFTTTVEDPAPFVASMFFRRFIPARAAVLPPRRPPWFEPAPEAAPLMTMFGRRVPPLTAYPQLFVNT